ncbi:MAG: polysaccharide biosynthesis C-terminal domain-containing protein [Mogibacterium sp.]|nr:polysaccharide biosynthesis C-terminal domain-containing protein [Mogibacterium sp.]
MRKKFYSYVIPTLLAQLLWGVYCVVDCFFIGNRLGDDGLAAIGLAYPIIGVLTSAGFGIGMGGSILRTIREAAGKKEQAADYDHVTVTMLVLTTGLFLLAVPFLLDPLLRAVGAEGQVFAYGRTYLRIMFFGSLFQLLGSGLPPLIRNHGSASVSMAVMVTGCLTNIVLDYVFIMRMDYGVSGAAWATVLGQALAAAGGAAFFLIRRIPVFRWKLRLRTVLEILRTGISSFGISLCPSIGLFLMNLFLVAYGGMPAIAAYSIISYMTWVVYLVLQGTGDGCQPLLSASLGAGDAAGSRGYERLAYRFAMILAILSMAALYVTRNWMGPAFGASEEISGMVGHTMPILLLGFVPLAYARVTAASFYAAAESGSAAVLTYGEYIFLFLFLLILPRLGGLEMVWWSLTVSQCAAAVLAYCLMARGCQRPHAI